MHCFFFFVFLLPHVMLKETQRNYEDSFVRFFFLSRVIKNVMLMLTVEILFEGWLREQFVSVCQFVTLRFEFLVEI